MIQQKNDIKKKVKLSVDTCFIFLSPTKKVFRGISCWRCLEAEPLASPRNTRRYRRPQKFLGEKLLLVTIIFFLFIILSEKIYAESHINTPKIEFISISYSGSNIVTVSLTVITNINSECKYDRDIQPFNFMNYTMTGLGKQHIGAISYSEDSQGSYYVICKSEFEEEMENPITVTFDVKLQNNSKTSEQQSHNICEESWVCESWSECKNMYQTRKCIELNNCGTNIKEPNDFQPCKNNCEEIWQCDKWSICENGIMSRKCYDLSNCVTEYLKPSEYEKCEFIAHCYNSVNDNNEEGIDCGGDCNPCDICYDRVQNQDEEGIDCGGNCRTCRQGDLITTGRSILIPSQKQPDINFLFVFLGVIILLFLISVYYPNIVHKRRKESMLEEFRAESLNKD
ncbi:MAG: hypothetical protein AABY14_00080 [Nanoarchaeota archaeon]